MNVAQDVQPTANDERLEFLVRQVLEGVKRRRRVPGSTYRLQFHADFTFQDACQVVPYLRKLGITDCYTSPYLKARPGSKHGYDISDHQSLNPEIGAAKDYAAWAKTLQAHDMGQILDIVPNHMGIVGNENAWWNDILENGPCARHAGYFDIDWNPLKPDLHGKVMLCILGDPYGKALESEQIKLLYEAGGFVIQYFEHRFPVAPESSLLCLRLRFDEAEHLAGKESAEYMEYHSILTALAHLPGRGETDPLKIDERYREKEVIKRRLAALTDHSAPVREFVKQNVALFNGNKGDPKSFDLLDQLLCDQSYRLAYWQVAADEINYRRFFDVNDLAALSMEKAEVFLATHSLILQLIGEGTVTGLRIDHPDGLFDPKQYFATLQHNALMAHLRCSPDLALTEAEFTSLQPTLRKRQAEPGNPLGRALYLVAEKILGRDERIPDDWPIHGTTGYEFLNQVNGLFVASAHEAAFSRIYERWTGMSPAFRPYVYEKKFLILQVALSGELHVLAQQLDRLSEKHRWSRDFTLNSLRHALREIIACFPVYRSYITDAVAERDRHYIEMAVVQAKRKNPLISASIFDFVRDMLLLRYADSTPETDRADQRRFVGKFQQVTAPVMAKGLEDTSFYVYNRMVCLNEVGGDPGRFGISAAELHEFLQQRRQDWPHAMSSSSTHDTKRSEDVRARLNVLSEIPGEWQKALSLWKRLNKRHRFQVDGADAPDRNDEYLLYQTLVGAWPLNPDVQPGFAARIAGYMTKAVHEAKVHSSWTNPNSAYDEAVRQFVTRILDEKISAAFIEHFRVLQARVNHFGLFNALSQALVKMTAPGVPDFYQGTELWDFSLVDPDNRRPVDYRKREAMLDALTASVAAAGDRLPSLTRELVEQKEDGRIKLFVIWKALQCRRAHAQVFADGEYVPLEPAGSRADNLFAFARRLRSEYVITAVPRMLTHVIPGAAGAPLGQETWQETVLALRNSPPASRYRNAFTGDTYPLVERDGQATLLLADVFAHFPVALLTNETNLPRARNP